MESILEHREALKELVVQLVCLAGAAGLSLADKALMLAVIEKIEASLDG